MRTLTLDQAKSARRKALQNARELVEEAELLLDHKRWARALFLCQIAGEEIGKYILLNSVVVCMIAGDVINWTRLWKRLTSHQEKLELVTFVEDMFLERPLPDQSEKYKEELEAEVRVLEQGKQKSLYCDFTGEMPHLPSEVIGEDMARNALKWAKGRIQMFSQMEEEWEKAGILEKISKADIVRFRDKFHLTRLFQRGGC
jgi:AbiV family abortive infection protein